MMNEIRLLFGKPVIEDRARLIVAIKNLQSRHGLIALALDADKIVSERHIHFAVEKAISAFSEQRNIAKDAGVEIMRYASGERQIERALAMGVSDRTQRMAVILVGEEEHGRWPDNSELAGIIEPDGCGILFDPEVVKDVFRISSQELQAVGEERMEDLVIERVALVDTYR